MIRIEYDTPGDFFCPKCSTGYCVESWGSEYNYPLTGVSTVCCLECKAQFKIEVAVEVKITVHH